MSECAASDSSLKDGLPPGYAGWATDPNPAWWPRCQVIVHAEKHFRGRYGALLWVKAPDVRKAAKVLGIKKRDAAPASSK